MKKGILLVNLGSPISPAVSDVRKYLVEFLSDERVIDLPVIQRQLLVRGIIAPFRSPKSAKLYQKIWSDQGSPLIVHSNRLKVKLQSALGPEYHVELAMRYQKPSLADGIDKMLSVGCNSIAVVPLFPQYASATNGSVIAKVMDLVNQKFAIPSVHFTGSFHNHPKFIEAFAEQGRKHELSNYDHVLFSFHGLPERQIRKTVPGHACFSETCCDAFNDRNYFCYRAQCFDTARRIAAQLQIPQQKYSICFQSRLGKTPWIKPYADETIKRLAGSGAKKILVFSPSFVADCLETIYEIGVEYDAMFRSLGGEKLTLVESLNDSELFVQFLAEYVQ